MREGHLFTYKLHEIGQWPEWYKAAFHSSNYTPNNLTEGQPSSSTRGVPLTSALAKRAAAAKGSASKDERDTFTSTNTDNKAHKIELPNGVVISARKPIYTGTERVNFLFNLSIT